MSKYIYIVAPAIDEMAIDKTFTEITRVCTSKQRALELAKRRSIESTVFKTHVVSRAEPLSIVEDYFKIIAVFENGERKEFSE